MPMTEATLAPMQVHTLEPERFDLLAQAPDGIVPDPRFITAIVAEQDGKLLGRMFLCLMPHIEGTWIDEAARSGTIGYRLAKQIEERCREIGVIKVMAYCMPEHETYMERLGFTKCPYTVWEKDV